MTEKIKLSYSKEDKVILTSFTNGTLDHECNRQIHYGYHRGNQKVPEHAEKHMLVAETDEMTYVGQNYGPLSSTIHKHCKYYLGVLDKKSGKMRVCETEIYQMHPKPSDEDDEDIEETTSLPSHTDKTFVEKNDMLTSAFGSQKKKRAMESRLKNQIKGKDLENAMSSAVNIASTAQLTETDTQQEENIYRDMPLANKDALSPKDVYSLSDIISPTDMELMSNASQIFYDATNDDLKNWKSEKTYPDHVLHLLWGMSKVEDRRREQTSCIMYLNYMLHLYQLKTRSLNVKNPLPVEWPNPIKAKLLKTFVNITDDPVNRIRQRYITKRMKDKLILYILVLCLILDEFSVDMTDLCLHLNIDGRKLIDYFKTLGCKCSTTKRTITTEQFANPVVHIATLAIPLHFPVKRGPKKNN